MPCRLFERFVVPKSRWTSSISGHRRSDRRRRLGGSVGVLADRLGQRSRALQQPDERQGASVEAEPGAALVGQSGSVSVFSVSARSPTSSGSAARPPIATPGRPGSRPVAGRVRLRGCARRSGARGTGQGRGQLRTGRGAGLRRVRARCRTDPVGCVAGPPALGCGSLRRARPGPPLPRRDGRGMDLAAPDQRGGHRTGGPHGRPAAARATDRRGDRHARIGLGRSSRRAPGRVCGVQSGRRRADPRRRDRSRPVRHHRQRDRRDRPDADLGGHLDRRGCPDGPRCRVAVRHAHSGDPARTRPAGRGRRRARRVPARPGGAEHLGGRGHRRRRDERGPVRESERGPAGTPGSGVAEEAASTCAR